MDIEKPIRPPYFAFAMQEGEALPALDALGEALG